MKTKLCRVASWLFVFCLVSCLVGTLTITAQAAAIQLVAAERALEIRGALSGDYFGRPLLCADINNDGYDDLFICSDRYDFTPPQRPTLYVFKGQPYYSSRDLIDLSTEPADTVIYGESGSDNFASALAGGDLNGDGVSDLVAADSTLAAGGRSGAGAVYVLFGRNDFFSQSVYDLALGSWDLKVLGASAYDDTGGSNTFGGLLSKGLACADINHDGVDDLAVGAHLATANSLTDAGKLFLIWGNPSFSSPSTIDLASQADSVILGDEGDGQLGTAITAGDLNTDGIDDLVLGMEHGSKGTLTTEGKVFVFWGTPSFPSSINLLTQPADLTLVGDTSWDRLGAAVALSDVNGDYKADLLVTAPGWDHAGSTSIDEGAVYGFWGKSSFPATIDLSSQSADLFVEGYNLENNMGDTLHTGDVNGDGVDDFFFSSRDGERPSFNTEGRTFLVLGGPGLPSHLSVENEEADFIINGGVDSHQLGDAISAGDIDGDGSEEILISAPFVDSVTGRTLVFDLTPVTLASPLWILY